MAAERGEQAMMSVTVNVTRAAVIKWLVVLAVVVAVCALQWGGLGVAGAEAAEAADGEREVAAQTGGEDVAQPASHTPGHELLLNVVEPCVVFDTRDGGGKLAGGENRTFAVVGPQDLSAQGGAASGCGIATDAQAVVVNVVAIEPEGAGNLRAHAGDLPPQGGSGVVNYQRLADNLNNSNQIVLSVRQADKGVDDVLIGANGAAVHVRGIVSGYYTPAAHADTIAALQARVDDLEALLAGVTRSQVDGLDTLRFTGMNLQIVNGTNTTDGMPNGLGNLIIGYNAQREFSAAREGSHYLVVGDQHEWTRFGGILAGFHNNATGDWASVSGGWGNIASGVAASVSGGRGNTASGENASVSGGSNNNATGVGASVSGGSGNTASGVRASVSGGFSNRASGTDTSILGGLQNIVSTPQYACHPAC